MTPKTDQPAPAPTPVKPLPTVGGEYIADPVTGEHVPVEKGA